MTDMCGHIQVSLKITYIYNEKVQPAPCVGEVGLEAVCDPFKEHLDDKDVRENFVSKLQNDFNGSSSFYIYVFKGLPMEDIRYFEVHSNSVCSQSAFAALTRAPLLRRIMKTMKVSNQSCSTIVKQARRRFHHFLPLPWVMSTVRHGQRFTQSVGKMEQRTQGWI